MTSPDCAGFTAADEDSSSSKNNRYDGENLHYSYSGGARQIFYSRRRSRDDDVCEDLGVSGLGLSIQGPWGRLPIHYLP